MNDAVAKVARAIDPLAFGDWATPPRGLESANLSVVQAEQTRRQNRARKQAQAAIKAYEEALWQPIETAPKNENILVWDGEVLVAKWVIDRWWLVDAEDWGDGDIEPTHWQPLPTPP